MTPVITMNTIAAFLAAWTCCSFLCGVLVGRFIKLGTS